MIELNIELEKLGKTLHFEFNHSTIKKFAAMGGDPSRFMSDIIGSIEAFIRACLVGEGSVSVSKAENLYDAIAEEYDIPDIIGMFAEKYYDSFTGGEEAPPKKKLSEMK